MCKGCSRLFMFDVNNNQFRFSHLYVDLRELLLNGSKRFNSFKRDELKPNNTESDSVLINHSLVESAFLNEVILVIGKYFMYYEEP